MKLKTMTIFAAVMLAACSLNAAGRASLLKKNSDVVLNISDISEIGDALKTTSFGNLWNDPAFQKAIGEYDLEKTIKEGMFSELSEEQQHLYWEEIRMLKGCIALAVNISGKTFTLAAEMSEDDFKRSLIMDRRLTELEPENKMIIRKENYQGTDIYAHLYENNADGNSWQAFIGNTLILSNDEKWIKKSIARLKKSPITANGNKTPSITLDIQIKSILDNILKEYEDAMAKEAGQNPDSPMAMPAVSPTKIIDAAGLSDLTKLHLSVKIHKDRIVSDSLVTIKKPLTGLLSISDLSPSSLNLRLPYAPESIISYEISRLNLLALWQQIPQMITKGAPETIAPQLNAGLMGMAAILGVDPGRDLFAHLDTQYAAIFVDSNPEPEGLYFLRIKDETALNASMQRMFDDAGMLRLQLGEKFKIESFRDADIYEFKMGETNGSFAVTAEAGYLVMGSGKIIRQYLRAVDSDNPANQAFYKSRLYAELRTKTPAKACGYSAMDIGKYVKVFLGMIVDNPALKGLTAANNPANKNNPFPNFDMSKLPSAEYMSKFFGASFGYAVPTASGIKSRSVIYYGKNK